MAGFSGILLGMLVWCYFVWTDGLVGDFTFVGWVWVGAVGLLANLWVVSAGGLHAFGFV